MIVDVQKRFVFVHIPRTAGISVCMSLKPYVSSSVIFDTWIGRHRTAAEIKRLIGPVWDECFRFCIWRPVSEITESFHRLVTQAWAMREHIRDPLWLEFVSRTHELSADELWASIGWPSDDEPWRLLWLTDNGVDLGVTVYDFCNLRDAWPDICGHCHVPTNIPLLHLNRTQR